MARIQDIRRRYFNEGQAVSEIARDLGIDRKTVRKYRETLRHIVLEPIGQSGSFSPVVVHHEPEIPLRLLK